MAGTINIALTQCVDLNGQPMAGALLYIFAVGTVATPQDAFQDFGLAIKQPWPMETDQYGRIPMLYLADGQVHARLTDSTGVVIFDYATMQVVGPSSGGGGGGGGSSVDPTAIFSTGDFKWRPTSETLSGWVKSNTLTIGNATSGASQRANSDTQSLFVYLWQNFTDAKCPVSGGRGATALADFTAGKTIATPDMRSRGPIGLDDMGASAAGIILASNVTSGGGDGPTTPAAWGGEANHTLATTEMPSHTHAPTLTDPGHLHTLPYGGPGGGAGAMEGFAPSSTVNSGTAHTGITLAIANTGGGLGHNNCQPFVLGTFYIKM
jgi:microcystin-dependent protein